jgi:periplasmic protein CpxP/Spy
MGQTASPTRFFFHFFFIEEFSMKRTTGLVALTKTSFSRIVLAGLIAVPVSGAMAQTAAPTAPAPAQGASSERVAPVQGMHRDHHDPARMQARMEKRQAVLKSKLKLAPEQEGAWSAFTAAMKPPARPPHASPEQRAELQKLPTPERIDKMRAERSQRIAEMSRLMDQRGEAAKTFYGTLTPEQKKTFDAEAFQSGHSSRPRRG